jgi:hypothetical protein
MVAGVAAEDVMIPLPVIQDREIRLAGSAMYVRRTCRFGYARWILSH